MRLLVLIICLELLSNVVNISANDGSWIKQDNELFENKRADLSISYEDALLLASKGMLSGAVIEAMRAEIIRCERGGPSLLFHALNVRINLGVALMQLGNLNSNPVSLYSESEQLFLSVLKVHPEQEAALKNLESVRKNRQLRGLYPLEPNDGQLKQTAHHDHEWIPKTFQDLYHDRPPRTPSSFFSDTNSMETPSCKFDPRSERLLTIGIPTVPREGNPKYLSQTLNAIISQLPLRPDDPLYASVIIVVLNNRPGEHQEFEDVKKMIGNSIYSRFFKFEEVHLSDLTSDHIHAVNWIHNPSKVVRQTRAVVSLLRLSHGLSTHFMFMEDDFLVCPNALRTLQYIISKAHAYYPGENWSGIRVSYGLCGIVVMNKDMSALADYLLQHEERLPPDHLVPEWIASESTQAQAHNKGRQNIAYRFNLMRHIGHISTLSNRSQVFSITGDRFAGCFEELSARPKGHLLLNEAWKPVMECLSDDFWPCDRRPDNWPRSWPMQVIAKGAQFLDNGAAKHKISVADPHDSDP